MLNGIKELVNTNSCLDIQHGITGHFLRLYLSYARGTDTSTDTGCEKERTRREAERGALSSLWREAEGGTASCSPLRPLPPPSPSPARRRTAAKGDKRGATRFLACLHDLRRRAIAERGRGGRGTAPRSPLRPSSPPSPACRSEGHRGGRQGRGSAGLAMEGGRQGRGGTMVATEGERQGKSDARDAREISSQ